MVLDLLSFDFEFVGMHLVGVDVVGGEEELVQRCTFS